MKIEEIISLFKKFFEQDNQTFDNLVKIVYEVDNKEDIDFIDNITDIYADFLESKYKLQEIIQSLSLEERKIIKKFIDRTIFIEINRNEIEKRYPKTKMVDRKPDPHFYDDLLKLLSE